MKWNTIYETEISDARWWAYDIPGNVGWIMYLICLIRCFLKHPACMDIPLVRISLLFGIIPAIAMLVGIAELISERIMKLDRVLPGKRLYRGFGALAWGGLAGGIVGANALFAGIRGGYSMEECRLLALQAVGGMLCALFAGLILKTFHPQNKETETL